MGERRGRRMEEEDGKRMNRREEGETEEEDTEEEDTT